jgi:hypothetical protein
MTNARWDKSANCFFEFSNSGSNCGGAATKLDEEISFDFFVIRDLRSCGVFMVQPTQLNSTQLNSIVGRPNAGIRAARISLFASLILSCDADSGALPGAIMPHPDEVELAPSALAPPLVERNIAASTPVLRREEPRNETSLRTALDDELERLAIVRAQFDNQGQVKDEEKILDRLDRVEASIERSIAELEGNAAEPARWFRPEREAPSAARTLAGPQTIPDEPASHLVSACPPTHNAYYSTSGADYVSIVSDNVCLATLAGDDSVYVYSSAENPYLLAGSGHDVIQAEYWVNYVTAAGGDGNDTIWSGDYADFVWGQNGSDDLRLEYGDDYGNGGAGNDVIHGSRGNDELIGGTGDDALWGEEHDDLLIGGDGNDLLVGDSYWLASPGNDVLIPGAGRDEVWGDSGDDTVIIYDVCELQWGEYLDGGPGYDTLISPIGLSELNARGVSAVNFESVQIDDSQPYLASCSGHTPNPECRTFPKWRSGSAVGFGTTVTRDGVRYRCIDSSGTGRCNSLEFDPAGDSWELAWELVGRCLEPLAATCESPPAAWLAGHPYQPGDLALGLDNNIYSCNPWPASNGCGDLSAAPGAEGDLNAHWTVETFCDFSDAIEAPADLGDPAGADNFDPLLRKWGEHYEDAVAAVYNYMPEREIVEEGAGFYIDGRQIIEGNYSIDSDAMVQFGSDIFVEEADFRPNFFLTREEAEAALQAPIGRANLGSGTERLDYRWEPGTVYYWTDMDSKFSDWELPWVLAYWGRVTPYSFERSSTRTRCEAQEQCILFLSHKSKCSTPHGNRHPSSINVNKKPYCRGWDNWRTGWHHGAMLHEVGHALGLRHEHQRPDAYLYGIEPVLANVESGEEDQFVPFASLETTGYGFLDKKSVMMYSRTASSRNGRVTIKGAPKKPNRKKIMPFDAAGVLAVNFWQALYLTDRADFTGNRLRATATPETMWRAYRGTDGDFGNIANNNIRAANVPGGVLLKLFDLALSHDGDDDELEYGPSPESEFYSALRGDISRFQMRPALTLFEEQGFNEGSRTYDPGLTHFGSAFDNGADALILGHGLRTRLCHGADENDPASWRCEVFPPGIHRDEGHADELQTAEVEVGVTLYVGLDFQFEERGLIETVVPNPDGSARVWFDADLEEIDDMNDVQSIYVHPGISVEICAGRECLDFAAGSVRELPVELEDPDRITVHSAVTLFAEDNCDAGRDHQTFRLGTYTATNGDFDVVGDQNVESLVVGPGLRVELCDQPSGGGPCVTYEPSPSGNARIVDAVPEALFNDISYMRVEQR